jgi:isopentenyl diphosphate isomerase/L-lactate dehydrogenase-like FMN-dependent dehydrogenase
LAGPFLRAASNGAECAVELGLELTTTLRVAMFGVGAASVRALRGTARLEGPERAAPLG